MRLNPLRKHLRAWKHRRANRLQVLVLRDYLLEKGLSQDEITQHCRKARPQKPRPRKY